MKKILLLTVLILTLVGRAQAQGSYAPAVTSTAQWSPNPLQVGVTEFSQPFWFVATSCANFNCNFSPTIGITNQNFVMGGAEGSVIDPHGFQAPFCGQGALPNDDFCYVRFVYNGTNPVPSVVFGNFCFISGCIQITVYQPPLTSVSITPTNPTILPGATQQFKAIATFADSSQLDVTNNSSTTWSSSNTGVATISASGLANGLAIGTSTISASYTDGNGITKSGSTTLTVSASLPPPASMAGKWVLFQTSPSPTSSGHSCFDAKGTSCYELYVDLQDSNNSLSSPADPLNPGAFLAIDNANCGGGTPSVTGNVSGTNVGLGVSENILYGALGGVFAFNGSYSSNQPYTGFNFDGSQAPFSGTANEIIGTNASSGGCPAQDAGVTFNAWKYPSLGSASVTLNVISQPGVLNLPVTIGVNLQENPDFSVSGSGTLTGPSCGPLTFTTTDGQAIGNLYAVDANYKNPAGGTGTLSIGLSLITPFIVSQQQLQNAGYVASGQGYALQVWSVDWTSSSDGSCTADPIILGSGVAYPKHGKANPPKHDKKTDWKSFRERFEHARTTD